MAKLDDARRALLNGRHIASFATTNADGTLHVVPIWYLFENDRIYVESHSGSLKVRNVSARPTASLMVDTRRPGTERWLSAAGPTEIIRGEHAQSINARIRQRYLTKAAIDDPRIGPVFAAVDDVTIAVTPQTWRAWDMESVDIQYFGGVMGKTPEKWYLPLD
ncbi:MAG: pyridoxamine 5'-phosphate oxidase family protein [Candidatus Binatia bacterium]